MELILIIVILLAVYLNLETRLAKLHGRVEMLLKSAKVTVDHKWIFSERGVNISDECYNNIIDFVNNNNIIEARELLRKNCDIFWWNRDRIISDLTSELRSGKSTRDPIKIALYCLMGVIVLCLVIAVLVSMSFRPQHS